MGCALAGGGGTLSIAPLKVGKGLKVLERELSFQGEELGGP